MNGFRCVALCGALMFSVSAMAQGDIRCWTSQADACYHMEKGCTGEAMYPISELAAQAFGKVACEKCVVAEKVVYQESNLTLAVRGGTYVLCIPVSSMESLNELPESETLKSLSGAAALVHLTSIMPESKFTDFSNRVMADGWAYDSCWEPEILLPEDVLLMSRRRVGENWYFVIRPQTRYGETAEIQWNVLEWDVQLERPEALSLSCHRADTRKDQLAVADHSDASVIFESDIEAGHIIIYRCAGINTAVFHCDMDGKADDLDSTLVVGSDLTEIQLSGYINDNGQATYCCIVSDEELGDMVAGRMPEIKS